MRLLLIRHGQSASNIVGALDTAVPGAGLTSLGLSQAEATPHALAAEPIDAIYTSRLLRTQLTAAPLAAARGLSASVLKGLEEVGAGDLELRSDRKATDTYRNVIAAWVRGNLDGRIPGGPNGHEFLARFAAAVNDVASRHEADETVVIFSHGAAISAFAGYTALSSGVTVRGGIMNTGMATVVGSPTDGWALASWRPEPLGGVALEDPGAHDVTGEPVS